MQAEAPQSPFPGPRPFTAADRERFFGRAAEERDLTALVVAHPVTLLYGAVGSGKTSLIAAGVVPALERAGFEVLPVARVGALVPPGVDVARVRNVFTLGVLMHWHGDGTTVDALAAQTLAGHLQSRPRVLAEDGSERPRVIVVDQLEDLFSAYPAQYDQREAFLRDLAECLRPERARGTGERAPVLHVLLAIDEALLGELERHTTVLPDLMRVRYHLGGLTVPAAIEALTGPVKQLIGRAEAETLARSLAQRRVYIGSRKALVPGETVEPMHLQLACEELLRRRGRPGALGKIADPDEALVRYYDGAVDRARSGWGSERRIRRWFSESLLRPDGKRLAVLEGKRSVGGLAHKHIEALAQANLLRIEQRLGARWYELAHDRLIAPIQRSNAAWFEAQRQSRRRWRIAMTVMVLLLLAAGAAYLAQTGWRIWERAQAEKLALEEERESLVETRGALEGKLALGAGEQALAAARDQLRGLQLDVQALDADLRVAQIVVFEMGRYRPSLRDVDIEAETLTNFVAIGSELPGLGARVEVARQALQALQQNLSAAHTTHAQPELKDGFTELEEALERPGDVLTDLGKSLEAVRTDYQRFATRLSENLGGFESPPRPGSSLPERVREQSRAQWREGLRALVTGDLATARTRFQRSLERDSTNPAAHDMLGRLAWAENRVDDAEPLFRQALSRDPRYAPAMASMAALYLKNGARADAARCVRRTLALLPNYALAHMLQRALEQLPADETKSKRAADNPCKAPAAATTPPAAGAAPATAPAE